ncbi:Alginate lyase [Reichenbachiella agariperforans]|uniref:Alginate lyase n=1 Tax=Reichenbachiella agariperforans TaxID=156994 RepID=A0A1M6M076_REIAG|nr:alginate lyase family protein [Reichenbachiella agariperforans]SHJ76891.1 Alginate lyase [Reichenbachiella agariperforans]
MKLNQTALLIFVFLISIGARAQPIAHIGSSDFSGWSGIEKVKGNEAMVSSGKRIDFSYPDGENTDQGFRDFYSGADWSIYQGLSFDIYQKKESNAEIELTFEVDEKNTRKLQAKSSTVIQLYGSGWQKVYVPWQLFDLAEGQRGTLQGVKDFSIKLTSTENQSLKIKDIVLTKGERIYLDASIRGKSAKAGDAVQYAVEIGNTTNEVQKVQLTFPRVGWEAMQASVNPSVVSLNPMEIKTIEVSVQLPATLPAGVREQQRLEAIANGDGSALATMEFTTAVTVPSPFMVHTADNWQKVRDKIENYSWAQAELEMYEEKASKWDVPDIADKIPSMNAQKGKYLFHSNEGGKLMDCAIAYQLTGKEEYAQKCVDFLRKLIDPETGYPTTLRVNQNNFVKEGGIFQDIARTYDMIRTSGLLTEQDHKLIENTFRLYIETAQLGNDDGGVNNWDLSELAGAFYCALAIQDWTLVDWTLHSPSGILRQFSQGIMSDGWWYECAVGYNLWCATMFSEIGIALRPWGINFIDAEVPIGTTPYYSLLPERMQPGLYGMNFDKWGTMHQNSVSIKDMWDALVPFLDYRGVMFAVNDAQESRVTGEPYELAYYLYKDPEYAAVLNKNEKRNLLYGVPELPQVTSVKNTQSAYADNMGVVQLRSQADGRAQRDQIQAVLHYGTHGGYHGHFDRTSFLSMMRYGRSFFNPEMIWYGYGSYNYKFLVQTSMTKNMVVVDQKMQEPKESFRTLFHTGDMMQATAVETRARWSNPPYGGIVYSYKEGMTFAEKTWEEGRSIDVPENAPEYGKINDFTEPVTQRRVMVMMDDYVVLADYLASDQAHTFDWLFQMKGFQEISAPKKEFLRHDNQFSTDPLGAAQFFTDVNWYQTEGTARSSFEMCFGEGCDNKGTRAPNSEDGPLKIDVFNAWPLENEVAIATVPESHGVNKQLWYTVEADGETLLNDSTGAWILGGKEIDIQLQGKKGLVLSTQLQGRVKNNTVFWGNARLVKADGSEVLLSSLDLDYQNILQPDSPGLDYYGGPIKISGELMESSIPGMPENSHENASISLGLSGMDVVAFKAKIGGDFPLGDETPRRKTLAVRSEGKEARYLSVIEPFESESMIKSVRAKSEKELEVVLKDGRVQRILIENLEGEGTDIKVSTQEYINGELVREESSK